VKYKCISSWLCTLYRTDICGNYEAMKNCGTVGWIRLTGDNECSFFWKEIIFNIVANGQRPIFFLNKSYDPKMSFTDILTHWITLYDSFIPRYLRTVEHSLLDSWMLSSLCHLRDENGMEADKYNWRYPTLSTTSQSLLCTAMLFSLIRSHPETTF
jgi:hypothetical protein